MGGEQNISRSAAWRVIASAALLLAANFPRTGLAAAVVHAAGTASCDQTAPIVAQCAIANATFHFGPTFSAGSAKADLAAGKLTASAGVATGILGVGTGQAEISDTINLILPAGYTAPLVPVTVSLTFPTVTLVDDACADDRLILGAATDGDRPRTGGGKCVEPDGHGGFVVSGSGLNIGLTVDFSSTGPLTGIVIDALLQTFAGDNSGNGYANIDPNLTIGLPAGVTFTSGSGHLLNGIPEPMSLALLGSALAGLCAARRYAGE